MEQFLRVGVISSTHGVIGEVKVFPTTDDINRFKSLKSVLVDLGNNKSELEIENVKFFKQFAILKFKGIDNINDVLKYKGKDIYVSRENAVPLKKGEYFICDIIGAKVFTEDNAHFGVIKDVLQTGANDVYAVETDNGKEVLLPVIKECILDIDIENKRVMAHIMKGLI